jgi:hypothetical protein
MSAGETGCRYCGRLFTISEIERIRELIASEPRRNRAQLSRVVCDELSWLRPDGRRKEMSCRVAMLRMERDRLISLPPPERGNGNGHNRPIFTPASNPREPLTLPVHALTELSIRPVANGDESSLWNELIERYHYLGYKPLPGAQLRYMAFSGLHLLAVMGFGAAAWSLAPRDRFVGWTTEQRQRNLHRVINNARFLIVPWVSSRNLASRLLSAVAKRLPQDWQDRYAYRPALLETFVEQGRFRGTCYRAANWICVGETQGRGKKDRQHRHAVPVKRIFLYPLNRRFRSDLCATHDSQTS